MKPCHAPDAMPDWQQFILSYGAGAHSYELAAVLGCTADEIEQVRRTQACKGQAKAKRFAELFVLWHGRQPQDHEWPAPRKMGASSRYEWQAPELALLASLVGQLSRGEIASMLTARLRKLTGDDHAQRSIEAVQLAIGRIGLQASDVLGGITTTEAAREIGSLAIIHHAIRSKQLRTARVGRLLVIPHDVWREWKAKRVLVPEGYIQLSSIREALAIRSDKLSEFARMGYVPTAIRCTPVGSEGPSTQFGTWYIEKSEAERLVAARRAGLPMPWHGKPMADNLRVTYKLWQQRQHPDTCATCRDIWGEQGVPPSFEDYAARYPALAHGAKRHLTRPWNPGLTVGQLAEKAGCSENLVRQAIQNGMLDASVVDGEERITLTEATRWRARRCPSGESTRSWISLETACKQYLFTPRELRGLIARQVLPSKIGTDGAQRGVEYVSRHQCALLRAKNGFTEEQAARRVGVTVPRLRELLDGVAWRKAEGIPLVTVQAVIKRLESNEGYSIEEAAEQLGKTPQWVRDRIADGTVKLSRAKWDRRRVYLSVPMMQRLQQTILHPVKRERLGDEWLRVSKAAAEAGVSVTTILHWGDRGELSRKMHRGIYRYHREAVRARARTYWADIRFHRATPPAWLAEEWRQQAGQQRDLEALV